MRGGALARWAISLTRAPPVTFWGCTKRTLCATKWLSNKVQNVYACGVGVIARDQGASCERNQLRMTFEINLWTKVLHDLGHGIVQCHDPSKHWLAKCKALTLRAHHIATRPRTHCACLISCVPHGIDTPLKRRIDHAGVDLEICISKLFLYCGDGATSFLDFFRRPWRDAAALAANGNECHM